jgi:hypothetical protein
MTQKLEPHGHVLHERLHAPSVGRNRGWTWQIDADLRLPPGWPQMTPGLTSDDPRADHQVIPADCMLTSAIHFKLLHSTFYICLDWFEDTRIGFGLRHSLAKAKTPRVVIKSLLHAREQRHPHWYHQSNTHMHVTHTHTHTHTHRHTHTCAHTYARTHTHIHTHRDTNTHRHTHALTHLRTHTHIHTRVRTSSYIVECYPKLFKSSLD